MGAQWKRTEEQQAYLNSALPKYLDAQAQGKGMACVLAVIEEWFMRWPESDEVSNQPESSGLPLTEEEKAQRRGLVASAVKKRRKQLLNYLQWHVDKLKMSGGRVSRAKSDPLAKLLSQAPKRRKKQLAQVFAQLFKDRIDEQLNQIVPPLQDDTGMDAKTHAILKLSTRTRLMYEMWESADAETHKAVLAAKEKMDNDAGFVTEGDNNMDGPESIEHSAKDIPKASSTVGQITGAEMQKNIDVLGKVLVTIANELMKKTGWSITVLMGGLNEQGNLDIASVNVGVTPTTGLNFAKYVVDFNAKILQPFREFLSPVYPPELRQELAMEYNMKMRKMNSSVTPASEGLGIEGSATVHMEVMGGGTDVEAMELCPPSGMDGNGKVHSEAMEGGVPDFDFSGINFGIENLDLYGGGDDDNGGRILQSFWSFGTARF